MNELAIAPESNEELKSLIAERPRLLAVGNQTKPALCGRDDVTRVSLRRMTGIVEYEPSEFTFTARAGTLVSEIQAALAEKRQYLPFDPMLVDAGATIGGTVASGLSGPGRYRYGGIRDFLLGVRFFSGDGNQINAGGKVVKNAAGFDIPKFMVGSTGRFGVMTELSFKVFPKPVATHTRRVRCDSHAQAVERIAAAASSRWELDAIDYRPSERSLLLRLAGPDQVNHAIAREIDSAWGSDVDELPSANDVWRSVCELSWSETELPIAVKVPTTPAQFLKLCDGFEDSAALHWSVAGAVLWLLIDSQESRSALDEKLRSLGIAGLVLRGSVGDPRVGKWPQSEIEGAVKMAMDPNAKFPGM